MSADNPTAYESLHELGFDHDDIGMIVGALKLDPDMSVQRLRADLAIARRVRAATVRIEYDYEIVGLNGEWHRYPDSLLEAMLEGLEVDDG